VAGLNTSPKRPDVPSVSLPLINDAASWP
jgi:hypothetical protein